MVETSGSVLHLNHPYNATRVNAGKIDVRLGIAAGNQDSSILIEYHMTPSSPFFIPPSENGLELQYLLVLTLNLPRITIS